jgi:hypothetical protein
MTDFSDIGFHDAGVLSFSYENGILRMEVEGAQIGNGKEASDDDVFADFDLYKCTVRLCDLSEWLIPLVPADRAHSPKVVTLGLDPRVHACPSGSVPTEKRGWPGLSPAMTPGREFGLTGPEPEG